jgi:hypothetical protein
MLAKRAGLVAIAVVAGLVAVAASADAGTRLRFLFPFGPEYDDDSYGEPYFVPAPRYYYYYQRPRARPRYYSYQYEPDYYEPEIDPGYIPPPRKKKTTSLPSQKTGTKPAQTKTAGISCDKATNIVSDYGFTQVKPTACTGKVYAFSAQRDGKPFVIKMSSASGELTEVKKQ